MKKTILAPELADLPGSDYETTASSLAVITHHDDHRAVNVSGLAYPGVETITAQTRAILEFLEKLLKTELDGSLDDVTVTRFFVVESKLTTETRTRIHECRHEFFSSTHRPASTMVGVSALADERMHVELEAEAVIPDSGWETNVVSLSAGADGEN